MKHRIALFLTGLLICWTGSVHAEPADISAAARSVVRVVLISEYGGEPALVGHGSGFAIAPDLILTNAHVVEPARQTREIRIGVVPPQGESGWFARVVAFSRNKDLALLQLTEPGLLPAASFYTGTVKDGADVFAVGYPGNVDLAQGLNVGDIVSPTSPVKTRGNVSSGRSSRQFETILHNAAIGGGNSGGPLLDACGRVVGANTFGTISDGTDSEFYFAVSTREILRFLHTAKVTPHTTGIACRSMADLERKEAERTADAKALSREEALAAEEAKRSAEDEARHRALFAIISERENGIALAGLALILALAAGGAAFSFRENERNRDTKIAAGLAGLLAVSAIAAWALRPSFADVDVRAEAFAGKGGTAEQPGKKGGPLSGKLVCTIDLKRSRVTVSDISDLRLDWREDGCADRKNQFARGTKDWSRVSLKNEDDSVTVAAFDPASGQYRADRYFPDLNAMTKLRAEKENLKAPACGASEETARKFAKDQASFTDLLPNMPNERLVYNCRALKGAD